MKKNILLVLSGIILFFFILITAFMWYQLFYGKTGITPVNVLQVSLDKENNTLSETNAVPMSINEVQAAITPYEFSVNNTGTKPMVYEVILEELSNQTSNLLSRSQLGYQLTLNGKVIKTGMLSDINNNTLDERSIDKNSINRYQLRIFVSEKAVNTLWQNKYYQYKVNVKTKGE